MALFSKELNLLAHRIRRIAKDLTWGEAFRQAIELSKARVPAKPSATGFLATLILCLIGLARSEGVPEI